MTPGKPTDYGKIYAALRTSLQSYVSRFYRRSQDIEDVIQEAFIRVIEAQGDRDINDPEGYLYRVTKNLALTELGKISTKMTVFIEDLEPEDTDLQGVELDREMAAREHLGLLFEAVQALPPKCRHVFILRRVYGYSQKEIAAELGISVKTVEVHLTKAILHCTEFVNKLRLSD